MLKTLLPRTALALAVVLGSASAALRGQHASEFTVRDRTEIFIQHLVKLMNLDPARYQAMVLEYEIGTALAEASSLDGSALRLSNFIRSALKELNPEFRRAWELADAGKDEEASRALRPLLGHVDPYVSANARLLRAELDFRAGKYDEVIERCERILLRDRLRLIDDHRACELVAQCFEKLEKPLLEFAQYAILLIDYQELPAEVEAKAKARLAALNEKVGRPLHTVASWMNRVEKLLRQEITAEDPTQTKEHAIVTALDKLIELQEAKERNTCQSCGGNCKGGCRNGRPRGNRSNSHARVSAIPPPGEGITNLRGVSRANADSIWGQLRLKDATRALQSFKGKLPPRFEKLLEQYYRELSREQ